MNNIIKPKTNHNIIKQFLIYFNNQKIINSQIHNQLLLYSTQTYFKQRANYTNFLLRKLSFSYLAFNSPNKLKFGLNVLSYGIQQIDKPLKRIYQIIGNTFYFSFLGFSIFFIHGLCFKIAEYQYYYNKNRNKLLQKTTPLLSKVIDQQVLKNQSIVNNLTQLVSQLCHKDSIQYLTAKSIAGVLQQKHLCKTTNNLTKQVLLKNVIYENQGISDKLKQTILRLLQDKEIIQQLRSVIEEFARSESAIYLTSSGIENVLKMESIKQLANESLQEEIHSVLNDPSTKLLIEEKIKTYEKENNLE